MLYRCNFCGALFPQPALRVWKEPMPDGFFEPWELEVCPVCGDEQIEEEFEEVYDDDLRN